MHDGKVNPVPSSKRFAYSDRDKSTTDTELRLADVAEIKSAIVAKLTLAVGKYLANATDRDWFVASGPVLVATASFIAGLLAGARRAVGKGRKRVYFLFAWSSVIGRLFNDAIGKSGASGKLSNFRAWRSRCRSCAGCVASEPGRRAWEWRPRALAALLSWRARQTLGIPACCYGIRYRTIMACSAKLFW